LEEKPDGSKKNLGGGNKSVRGGAVGESEKRLHLAGKEENC